MKKADGRETYAAGIAGLFAAVAVFRFDLVLEAGRVTSAILAGGGTARWLLLGEIALFCAILCTTWRVISRSPARPAHDAAVAVAAAALGWAVEAWGTRTGIWRYYTGETPPLWIVPVWPLGAALVERFAARASRGPVPAWWYWTAAALAFAYAAAFVSPWLDRPAGWAGLAGIAAALTAGAKPREEFWTLFLGMVCVFFADLWGTTNGCWAYYAHAQPGGVLRGIGFGMALDAAVVVGALRLASLGMKFGKKSPIALQ